MVSLIFPSFALCKISQWQVSFFWFTLGQGRMSLDQSLPKFSIIWSEYSVILYFAGTVTIGPWRKVQVVNIMHPFSFSCDKGCGDYYNLVQWLNNLGDKFPKLSMYIKEICALHLWKYVRVSKLTHFYMDVVNSELCISAGASMSCLIMTNKFTD